MGDAAVGPSERRGHVDDARDLHRAHHRECVVVDVAIAVVEGDHGDVPGRRRLAFEHLEGAIERDDVVVLGEGFEVLAEGVLRDVERREAPRRLEIEVGHHPVVAEDEDPPAAHRAPLDRGEQVLGTCVVESRGGRSLRGPPQDPHRLALQIHDPLPKGPARIGAVAPLIRPDPCR